MAKGKRRWMVAAIRKHLLPELHGIGFETVPLTEEENQGAVRQACPFGRFRRVRDGVFDLLDIVMDKYGNAAFSMCAGTVTPAGIIDPQRGHFPADRLWACHLPDSVGVYQIPWLLKQFRVECWPWQSVTEVDVDQLVAKIAGFAPCEIDTVLKTGVAGPHVRKVS
jgi:hypothetical protein